MKRNNFTLLAVLIAVGMIGASAWAQYGPPPGTQMGPPAGFEGQQGPPTPEQIQQYQQQAQQQAQQQNQNQLPAGQGYTMEAGSDGKVFCKYPDTNPTPEVVNACQSALANSQKALDANGLPNGATGMPSQAEIENMKQGGSGPAGMSGKIPPEALAQAKEQIGSALDQINQALLQAEDQTRDLVDGQVPGASGQTASIKKARDIYNQARAALDSGDVQQAGKLLQSMPKAPTAEELDKLGITSDLINDIRKKMKDVLAQTGQIDDPSAQIEAQAEITAALAKLDSADQLLKKGDKKGAQQIMSELRKSAPDSQAMEAGNMMDRIPASKLAEILKRIEGEMAAGEKAMIQAESQGIAIDAEAKLKFAQGKAVRQEAQDLFDAGKIKEAATKLKELKNLQLQEYFVAFQEKVMPKDRQKTLLQQGKDGLKALELTIKNSEGYGIDTAELEALLSKLKPLITKAEEAFNAGDANMFLQYMSMARDLNTGDEVDKIIRASANIRAKGMITASLAQLEPGLNDLSTIIASLKKAGKPTAQAESLLADAKIQVAKARTLYDNGQYIEAGKALDNVTELMISLANIAKDSGLALSPGEQSAISKALSAGQKTDLSLVSSDKQKQITDMIKNATPQERLDLNNSMLNFDPALFDQIAQSRQKDKQFIDNVMTDVMPLLSPEEQAKFMEGKTGLMAESQGADKTISIIKNIKGVSTDTFKSLNFIKDQLKSYNFQPDTAGELQAKMQDFNDKIQTGEIKDPALVKAYVQTLEKEIKVAETGDTADKFKEGLIPAKNVDNNNPLFTDINYLVDEGALKPDSKGNINLAQSVNKEILSKMIQGAQDEGNVNLGKGNLTVKDALTLTAKTYGVTGTPSDLSAKLELSGKPNLNAPLTMSQAAEIVAGADQRWGGGQQ